MSDKNLNFYDYEDERGSSLNSKGTEEFDLIDISGRERQSRPVNAPGAQRQAPPAGRPSPSAAPARKKPVRAVRNIQNTNRPAGKAPASSQRPVNRTPAPSAKPAQPVARPVSRPAPAAKPVQKPAQPAVKRAVAPAREVKAPEKKSASADKRYSYPESISGNTATQETVKVSGDTQNKNNAQKKRKSEVKYDGKKKLTPGRVVGRCFIVLLAILLVLLAALYSLGLMLAYGPSKTARDKAVLSALQASATKWVPGLFLSKDTVDKIIADSEVVVTDTATVDQVAAQDDTAPDKFENAIDGMVYETVNGSSYKGYVLLIKDPSRVSVGTSRDSVAEFQAATAGMRIFELADKYNAVAALNGGEFQDIGGVGSGEKPMGLTYTDGKCVWDDGYVRTFIGIDKENKLVVRESMTRDEAEQLGIRDGVSFQNGNTLITNDGKEVTYYYAESNTGVAQRTAIGQKADGTFIFIATDGRTAASMGATRNDIINLLKDYGAVTAGMLDGGSSTMLYYRDYYDKYNINKDELDEYQLMGLVNKYKAFTNPRMIPTYFIVSPE